MTRTRFYVATSNGEYYEVLTETHAKRLFDQIVEVFRREGLPYAVHYDAIDWE